MRLTDGRQLRPEATLANPTEKSQSLGMAPRGTSEEVILWSFFLLIGTPKLDCPLIFSRNSAHPATALTSVLSASPKPGSQSQATSSDQDSAGSFVVLTVKLGKDGATEILRATEVKGKLIERQGPATNYIYEITKNGKVYAVGFLPEDTFALRGFKAPISGGEKIETAKYATISLNIPNAKLESAKLGSFGLRIFKVDDGSEVEAISPLTLEKLVSQDKASIKYELSGAAVALQVRNSGVR